MRRTPVEAIRFQGIEGEYGLGVKGEFGLGVWRVNWVLYVNVDIKYSVLSKCGYATNTR